MFLMLVKDDIVGENNTHTNTLHYLIKELKTFKYI